jgi:16S rRNA processing protein RimM
MYNISETQVQFNRINNLKKGKKSMQDALRVGVISSTHGIKGEVKVFPTTDDAGRFKTLKEVILDTGRESLKLEITNVKFFKKQVILKFKNYDRIEDIEKFKGKDIYVTRENAVKLEEGEYFIADLIGLSVILDDGQSLGILSDVLQTGANDVYIVKTGDNKEILIPAIKECILNVDLENKTMTIRLLEGLLD